MFYQEYMKLRSFNNSITANYYLTRFMVIKYIFENDVSYDTDVSVLNFAKIFILILIVLLYVSVHLISFFRTKIFDETD